MQKFDKLMDRIGSPENHSHIHGHLVYDKGRIANQRRNNGCSIVVLGKSIIGTEKHKIRYLFNFTSGLNSRK